MNLSEEPPRHWFVLIYKLPPEPTRYRASVWRKLRAAGAVYLQNGVAVLPADSGSERVMRGVSQQIRGHLKREQAPRQMNLESWKQRARQLTAQTYALCLAYRHPKTLWYAKVFAALVVGYIFSPIDPIPDFIPGVWLLDEIVVVPIGIWIASKMIPPEVFEECRQKARDVTAGEMPVSRKAAVVVVSVWLVCCCGRLLSGGSAGVGEPVLVGIDCGDCLLAAGQRYRASICTVRPRRWRIRPTPPLVAALPPRRAEIGRIEVHVCVEFESGS